MIKPMLANAISVEEINKKAYGYLMEPKLDGVRVLAEIMGGQVRIYTRTLHRLDDRFPNLCNELLRLFPEGDLVIDCELGYWISKPFVMDFNKTMRVVGSNAPEAIRKQEMHQEPICLAVFDVVFDQGFTTNMTQLSRRMLLQQKFGDKQSRMVSLVPQRHGYDEAYVAHIWDLGGEGVMLKNPNAPYKEGKRPTKHWFKVKSFHTADVFITGFQPGQGKYIDQVGAIEFSAYDEYGNEVLLGKCSGFTDTVRMQMSKRWQDFDHKVIEIRYFGQVGRDTEGLRHPQFIRFRPDKEVVDCRVTDI